MTFGPATIGIDQARGKAVLDLITMVPEVNLDGAKVPPVPLLCGPFRRRGSARILGTVPYDQSTYETGGGVVEISLTPEQVEQPIPERWPSASPVLAAASSCASQSSRWTPMTAMSTLSRTHPAITVRVKKRGGPPGEPITLSLAQYLDRLESRKRVQG